jgi:sporulation integral membrane protein YtvI
MDTVGTTLQQSIDQFIASVVLIVGIVVLLARYALGVLMPFFIAFLVSLLLKPAVAFFNEKLKLPRGLPGGLFVVLFYARVGFLLIILSIQLFAAAKSFFQLLPSLYTNTIVPWMTRLFASLQEFAGRLDPDAAAAYNVVAANVTTSLGDTIVNISRQVVGWVTNFTLKAPGFLLKLLITIIATVFLTADFPRIKAFVMRQLSEHWRNLLHNARVQLGRTLWSYTRSYAMILIITFGEIALGLTIIGVDNAAGIAVAIALFDILPVVGSGLVLLPWTIFTLISGDIITGIGLAVLYVIVIVRASDHGAEDRRRPRRAASARHAPEHGARHLTLRRHRTSRPAYHRCAHPRAQQRGRDPSV